jgi:Holliday junction resolvasome RuvABC endonuclease subunit
VIVVGIDSALEKTGYAILEGESGGRARLVTSGIVCARTGADVAATVLELAAAGPDLIAIERPFVKSAERGGNPATGLGLAVLLGRWLQAFEAVKIRTATVLASSWQPSVLAIDRWTPRAARKAAAVRWARAALGVELSEDEADAGGIAAWALGRARNAPTFRAVPVEGELWP